VANHARAIDAHGNDSAFVNSVVHCHSHKNSTCFWASWLALSISAFVAGVVWQVTRQSSSRHPTPSRPFEQIQNRRKQRIHLMLAGSPAARRL
jgi:hypothetical protein